MPIEITNLSHVYMPDSPFKTTAIHDINLDVMQGEFIGLIGHTGSGKSTLIQHMNGLLKPTSGAIFVDGHDLTDKKTDLRSIRKRVGLVFQYPEYQLFEETVALDIAYGPKNLGLSQDEIDERVSTAASQLGLDEATLAQSPFELSGGQKRRCAIAGVLAMQPDVLILDEPIAGLDPRGREEMLGLLTNLHEQRGCTMVMVSHAMDDVARLCSRILVMNQGTLAMQGTPDEVFARGDELIQMGLGLPEGAQLARALRDKGFDIPAGIWKTQDLAEALIKLLPLKGGDADAR
ncbi:energy-coupling factor transporter ATPase [Eubacteriales bacterium OttesenSCG-928-N13]|nr:energy-coupling factor transporter ATPase [Eubacteriales bacterium OttesenSCG-928-N13]